MTPYNGAFGCGFCEHEEKVVVNGNGYSGVYPLEDLPPFICKNSFCIWKTLQE